MEGSFETTNLRPQELEAVYDISRAVARSVDLEATLDEIITMARPVLIFDNFVLYLKQENAGLETAYARAIGRGRFQEADLAWGESIAHETFQSQQTTIRVEKINDLPDDRINMRYLLALPLKLGDTNRGVLVFIRFGGPPFLPDQIHLAEYIAVNIIQLIEHQQLVERIADLEARRRLDALQDGFIAMITHELLTPLGFIKGYATTLLRNDTSWDDETRREFLTIIDEEADRLRELIDNLLDSSRLQAGTLRMEFQPIRLDTLLKDISMRAASRYEGSNLQLNLQIKTPGLQILADPTRLAQVFDNLVSNAVKYAPGSPIAIRLEQHNDMAEIAVQDSGPGIAPEHLDKIFTRFYRVPGQGGSLRGTGLGLYICREILVAHHGNIRVNSTPGKGTRFLITLPLNTQWGQETNSNREEDI